MYPIMEVIFFVFLLTTLGGVGCMLAWTLIDYKRLREWIQWALVATLVGVIGILIIMGKIAWDIHQAIDQLIQTM